MKSLILLWLLHDFILYIVSKIFSCSEIKEVTPLRLQVKEKSKHELGRERLGLDLGGGDVKTRMA